MEAKYIIRSTERDAYFVAIHSYTPFYSTRDKARSFETEESARDYANKELFTDESAFEIVALN